MSFATYSCAPPTERMAEVGFSWPDLRDYAEKAIRVLQTAGPDAIDVVEQGFKMWSAISSKNLLGLLAAFTAAQRDVEKIIAAIRAEFDLTGGV